MAFSLYAATVPSYRQILGAVSGLLGAIEGVRRGVFSPDVTRPPDNFAALKARIAETLAALEASEASEVDAFVGRDMRFTFGVGR
jgi:hypothetical protein